MVALNFNAAAVEPQKAFEPIPANWYNVMIDESEMKPTKDTLGSYLQLRLNVMDGDFANRKIFCRLNLNNKNATTVEIAEGHLSAICHAVGVIQCETSEMLHGKPFQVKITVRPPKDDFEASNDCKAFKACDGSGGEVSGGAAGGGGEPEWAAGGDDGADAGGEDTGGDALEEVKEQIKEVAKEGTSETGTVTMNDDSEYTYQELLDSDFNDQEMIDGGYATLTPVKKVPPKKTPAKKEPAKKPAAKKPAKKEPAAETTVESDDTGSAEKPPWVK